MRVENRSSSYVGIKAPIERLGELADELSRIFGESVSVEYLATLPSYTVSASDVTHLRTELGADVKTVQDLRIVVAATSSGSSARLQVVVGGQKGVGLHRLVALYGRSWVTQLVVEHHDAGVADRAWVEADSRLRKMTATPGTGKGAFSGFYMIWQFFTWAGISLSCLKGINSAIEAPGTIDRLEPWNWVPGVLLLIGLMSGGQNLIFRSRIRVQPIAAPWGSWHPSSSATARWTVVAGVLAVPALLISVVALLKD
ncbi:hypothetical protein ACFWAP_26750 [Streptomyces goshikiensis]|uniref:hypothetical protein n=1 Tax=Streptomyces goshikiensis TaxID=1942 RepID=UPI00365E3C6A